MACPPSRPEPVRLGARQRTVKVDCRLHRTWPELELPERASLFARKVSCYHLLRQLPRAFASAPTQAHLGGVQDGLPTMQRPSMTVCFAMGSV